MVARAETSAGAALRASAYLGFVRQRLVAPGAGDRLQATGERNNRT